jgi:hypothetical protein
MGILRLALSNFYGVVVLALQILALGVLAVASDPIDILHALETRAVQLLTCSNGTPVVGR